MKPYVSWLIVPGVLLALIGAVLSIAAAGDDGRSADTSLVVLVVGVVLIVVGVVWQAEVRRRERVSGS